MTLFAEDITVTVKGYGPVVQEVSFQASSREVVGITGPSGAGKSTLARALCGLQPPDYGRVRTTPAQGRVVQLAYQNAAASFPPHLPVGVPLLDALRYARRGARRGGRREKELELVALLDSLGIPAELRRRRPSEVSGGQLQRLALARALAANPLFLILDEITSALDQETEGVVLQLVGRHRKTHDLGVIMVSHDLGLLERNCDRIIVLDDGRIVETGNPANLFLKPDHPTTRALVHARKSILGGIR